MFACHPQRQKELVRVFYTEVAALEDVLEEAVYALGTDARTILVQIRKCVRQASGRPSCWHVPPLVCQVPTVCDVHNPVLLVMCGTRWRGCRACSRPSCAMLPIHKLAATCNVLPRATQLNAAHARDVMLCSACRLRAGPLLLFTPCLRLRSCAVDAGTWIRRSGRRTTSCPPWRTASR